MGIAESNITKKAMKAVSRLGTRIFRVGNGLAWAGKAIRLTTGKAYIAQDGDILIKHGYPLKMGLINGSGDCIGWHPITVTPEMVGMQIAVFLNLEAKTADGRVEEDQTNFIRVVRAAGGIAGVFRSPEEAVELIQSYPRALGGESVTNSVSHI